MCACSALLFAALTAQSEIPALFAQRPIVLRHSRAAMYYPFIEALALTLVDMPIAFITLVLFSILLYFIVGLEQTAGQYLCAPSLHSLSSFRTDRRFFCAVSSCCSFTS